MNEKCYVTDDLFNKIEGMSKAQILALFENASYTPSFYAGALDNGVSYLYSGIKPTDALLKAILNHGLGTHTLTDIELDAINANVFSVLFFDIKTIVAKSDGTALHLNVVGESVSTLSSSSRVINNYTTANYVDAQINKIKDGEVAAKKALYASDDTSKGTIEERLTKLGFNEAPVAVKGIEGTTITSSNGSIKKQGKYCLLNFSYTASATPNAITTVTIPEGFRPKENLNICTTTGVTLQVRTDGVVRSTLSDQFDVIYGSPVSVANVGWEIN